MSTLVVGGRSRPVVRKIAPAISFPSVREEPRSVRSVPGRVRARPESTGDPREASLFRPLPRPEEQWRIVRETLDE